MEWPLFNDQTRATSGSENDSEHDARILGDTINGFGQGEAVCVIGELHRSAKGNC
jgi:hypothetical protein